jgi:hypothetical protein
VAYPNPLRDCKGGYGRLDHGLYDATDDVETVIRWWSGPYAGANIGGRIPESTLMIDIDPRMAGWTAGRPDRPIRPVCRVHGDVLGARRRRRPPVSLPRPAASPPIASDLA